MTTRWYHLLPSLGLGLALALALLALPARVTLAEGLGQIGHVCTVCPAGGGCNYTTIQAAVSYPGCGVVKVAQGVYAGVQGRPVPAGYPGAPASGLITQVVYISRTVLVQGGYTSTNWATPYPLTQPTTLDAGRLGRALVVAGNISPTIAGLDLTNGNAAGLGGASDADGGGGAYVLSATATLSANCVTSNTARLGGGLYLHHSPATLSANRVTSNTAAQHGGGVYLYQSPAALSANRVASNTAGSNGGGLFLYDSPATLDANDVTSTTAAPDGGGLFLSESDATLSANRVASNAADSSGDGGGLNLFGGSPTLISHRVASNSAGWGGGLFLGASTATLISNSVTANAGIRYGGGLFLASSDATLIANSVTSNTGPIGGWDGGLFLLQSNAWLTNTIIADNRGGGLYVESSAPRLVHTTLARNGSVGLYFGSAYGASAAWLTNTILASHTTGVVVAAGSMVTLNRTLWYSNTTLSSGAGILVRSGDVTGDPAFVDAAHGDYHLTAGSAAIDQGVDAGVPTDRDGRPRDSQPDLGAYEFAAPGAYLPIIVQNR